MSTRPLPSETRTPPQDLGAEQAVIGSVLRAGSSAGHYLKHLPAALFYHEAHQEILAALQSALASIGAVDLVTVAGELRRADPEEPCGGEAYLQACVDDAPPTDGVQGYSFRIFEGHLATLRRCAQNRALIKAASTALEAGYCDPSDPADVAGLMLEGIEQAEACTTERDGMAWGTVTDLQGSVGTVEWLWPDWIPRGHLSILAGEPGSGKSALCLWLATTVAQGLTWPDGAENTVPPAPVLLADSEGAQAVYMDRIERWGIPEANLYFPGADALGRVLLDDDKQRERLRAKALQTGVALVIIDSLQTSLGTKIDENSAEMGRILQPWQEFARDTGTGLLIAHHYNKARKGEASGASLSRLRGSSAIGAAGRSILAIDQPDQGTDTLRLQLIKSNLAMRPQPLGFRQHATGIVFEEPPRAPRPETAVNKAEEFLRVQLADQALPIARLLSGAKAQGISKNAVYRAKDALALVVFTDPEDPYGRRRLWGLPSQRGKA